MPHPRGVIDPRAASSVEVLRRHIAECHEQIGRHEALMERMIAAGHSDLLEQAQDLWVTMLRLQAMNHAELAEAEASAERPGR